MIGILLIPSARGFQGPKLPSYYHHHYADIRQSSTWNDRRQPNHRVRLSLSSNNDSTKNSISNKPTGVYVRPSAAVERGSGFFFPGLEGPRVRLFVGGLLLLATGANHVLSASTSGFSEALSVFYSLLVLLQGAIETSKEGRIETIAARSTNTSANSGAATTPASSSQQLAKQWSSSSSDPDWQGRVEWAAASFLSMTPATHMILLRQSSLSEAAFVEFWLGVTGLASFPTTDNIPAGATAALNTIQQSTGGRVALPSDHPAATGLLADDVYRRCVILQRITPTTCWVVASEDLLASFTKQDLQWLGRLAEYVAEE